MTHDSHRLQSAERRLRSAEALVADLARAVENEKTLAVYRNTGSARLAQARYQHALTELEAAPPPPINLHVVLLAPVRQTSRRSAIMAELRAYGRACLRARTVPIAGELESILDRTGGGTELGLESIAALVEGRK